ncbi:hypothetical protein J2S16_003354 [Cytobacillus kochii]|nr:hypothetical protein [Cytobacillus kochii]
MLHPFAKRSVLFFFLSDLPCQNPLNLGSTNRLLLSCF